MLKNRVHIGVHFGIFGAQYGIRFHKKQALVIYCQVLLQYQIIEPIFYDKNIFLLIGETAPFAVIFSGFFFKREKQIEETIGKDLGNGEILWADTKRNVLCLPFSFTSYTLTDNRLFVKRGVLVKSFDEVRLYRVLDIRATVNIFENAFKMGSVTLITADNSLGNFTLYGIKNPEKVKNLISEIVDTQRRKNRIYAREDISYDD